jgi:predicted acylesterase/phospholipase RssA
MHCSKLWVVVVSIMALVVGGCGTVASRNPVPPELADRAQVPEIPEARFWSDAIPPDIEQALREETDRNELRTKYPPLFGQTHNYLAISGGGSNGAFGAGLLMGWSEAGNRPEFQMVTGISTGALIAPFAFLGPAYDPVLKTVYTTTATQDIIKKKNWLQIPLSDAATDPEPLRALIRKYVDDKVISAIAEEHRKGRGLYIGTTDLDQMRARIWDIGAIAASGSLGAKDLVHRIMLASASIPAVFPPVRIQVEAQGGKYDELHVDGGTATQVFVYPASTDWSSLLDLLEVPDKPNIYVIRNAPLKPNPAEVEPKLIPIAGRAISSLIRTQGIGDLYLIYMLSVRDGADYHLAYIPEEFDEESTEPFDTVYMNKLFDLGFRLGRDGYQWADAPPGWRRGVLNGEH